MHRRSLIARSGICGKTLPAVGGRLCDGAEDTDASRPGRSCSSTPGLADQKDTDRLMDIVHARTDSAPPPRPSLCPTCGLTANNGVPRRDDQSRTAYYRDARDHTWSVTWLEVG
jgi:hypothetical protein